MRQWRDKSQFYEDLNPKMDLSILDDLRLLDIKHFLKKISPGQPSWLTQNSPTKSKTKWNKYLFFFNLLVATIIFFNVLNNDM